MASSQEAVIQELLFRLASVYIERLTHTNSDAHSSLPHTRRPLKSADDLVSLSFHRPPCRRQLEARGSMSTGCPSVPFPQTRYLKNALREFLQIW